jgi:hypothetical protein
VSTNALELALRRLPALLSAPLRHKQKQTGLSPIVIGSAGGTPPRGTRASTVRMPYISGRL